MPSLGRVRSQLELAAFSDELVPEPVEDDPESDELLLSAEDADELPDVEPSEDESEEPAEPELLVAEPLEPELLDPDDRLSVL